MENQKEIWRDVPGYNGFYEVSNLGRVKSCNYRKTGKEKILKQFLSPNGYFQLVLSLFGNKQTFCVHQLVGICFLGYDLKDGNTVIDHINNNKTDNRVDNLQITTYRHNTSKDQFRHNRTSKYTGVSWDKFKNKWKAFIRIDGHVKYLGSFDDEKKASLAYNKELSKL